jgi:hypothetical protein
MLQTRLAGARRGGGLAGGDPRSGGVFTAPSADSAFRTAAPALRGDSRGATTG